MIATMMVLPADIEGGYLLLLTEQGYIKKTALSQFDNLHGTVRTRSAIKLRVRGLGYVHWCAHPHTSIHLTSIHTFAFII